MQAKHTPGPWTKVWGKIVDSDGKTICMVTYRKNGPDNDALIAAAPDMLAALRAVADYWAGGDVPADIDSMMRAAIARATGEA